MIQIQKRLGAQEPEPDQGNGFTPSKSVAWTPLDEGFLDEGISLSNLGSFGGGGSSDKDIAKLINDIEEIKCVYEDIRCFDSLLNVFKCICCQCVHVRDCLYAYTMSM